MTNLLLINGNIFDGHSQELQSDKFILIENDRIAAITDERPDSHVDKEIDLAGKTVMPGLIDCHFHAYATEVNLQTLETLPVSYLAQRARPLMENALKRGFTTVRDAGGADYGLWRSIEEGVVQGPRLFYAGRAFSQTGGHVDVRPQHLEPCGCSNLVGNLGEVVDGVEALRKAVRETLRQGAHQIKLMVSGGISSPTDPIWMLQFSEEEILAAVDEASRRRSYVMAHAYTAETISRSVKLGVRSIEHGNLIDKDAAEVVAEHAAFVVPTLVTYDAVKRYGKDLGAPQTTLDKLGDVAEKGLEAIEICKNAGVKLGLGTDLLGEMHVHQLRELEIRSETQTPFEILHSATTVNAEIVQQKGQLGCVREGAFADLLFIDGNPLEGLSLLYAEGRKPVTVMKGGKII
ncbi:MAG: amidohydrolase family protein [Gammaproteobacteria bacterium]|nr:amidohydrolase family protein [Gammaproteobacteria bacterium]